MVKLHTLPFKVSVLGIIFGFSIMVHIRHNQNSYETIGNNIKFSIKLFWHLYETILGIKKVIITHGKFWWAMWIIFCFTKYSKRVFVSLQSVTWILDWFTFSQTIKSVVKRKNKLHHQLMYNIYNIEVT